MMELPAHVVMRKIIDACRLAQKLGAKIVGLGAFTSVVGDAGITVSKNVDIAVTTGNSYTVAVAIEATKRAVDLMGKNIKENSLCVIGASGAIGRVCAIMLAKEVKSVVLVGRNVSKLNRVAGEILYSTGAPVKVTDNIQKGLKEADIVVTATSSISALVNPEDLKVGAVVCDVARPRDVSRRMVEKRDDVLVIEGGIVEVPGKVNFNLDFGFPENTAYACMAETMILALEQRHENYSLGRNLTLKQVEEIAKLGKKHGFKLAGFRSFERKISDEHINRVREKAKALC